MPLKTILHPYLLKTLCLICFASASFAQSQPLISDVFVSGGFIGISNPALLRNDLDKLCPSSTILNTNRDKYSHSSNYYGYSSSSSGLFSGQIGVNLFKTKTQRSVTPLLRIGVSAGEVNLINDYLSYADRFPYDTLTSSRTGEQIITDSVAGSRINVAQQGQQICLNVALLFQTDPERRLSFFAGVEAGFGLSFNNRTYVSEYTFNSTHSSNEYYYASSYYGSNNYKSETHLNENGWLVQTGIPIGINLRLAKKTPLLNQFHLFTEIKPGLGFYHVPELKTYAAFNTQTLMGVRFKI